MSNPRSRLVETFQRGYMDDLADQNELDAAHAIEEDLEDVHAEYEEHDVRAVAQ